MPKKVPDTLSTEVFFSENYRDFIRAMIHEHHDERGYQKRLADGAGCNPSYMSQVLHSHIQLTMDQAACLCEFWAFNEDRTEYFLALVQLERAGSKSLKTILERKLHALRDRHRRLSERVGANRTTSPVADHTAYYSNWTLSAIHVMTSIPEFQTVEALMTRLRLPKSQVVFALDELLRIGFVTKEGSRHQAVVHNIHVPQDSPLNISNHFQWRTRSLVSIVESNPKNLHYTALYAMSVTDIERVREAMMEFISKSRSILIPSKEEEMVALCCDLFYV